MQWSPGELAAAAGGELARDGGGKISSAFIDSRAPIVGGLFVPIIAARDGHDFIAAAAAGGARAVLIDRAHEVPELDGSVAYVNVPGAKAPEMLRTGESLDGFTLIGFEASDERGGDALVFSHPKVDGLVRMKRAEGPLPEVIVPPLVVELKDATELAGPELVLTEIPRRAYQDLLADTSGRTWQVPAEEVRWWGEFGESDVLGKLVVNVAKDEAGTPRGIRLMSSPGAGTAASDGRGLSKGDTIKSVNGVPVTAKEDILRYLRGDGRGLSRYEVLVESESGVERTIVYEVERKKRRGPRR